MSEQSPRQVRVDRLAMLLRRKRQFEDLTLQDVAAQTGVSIATLSQLFALLTFGPDSVI